VSATIARRNIRRMAEQFILGETAGAAVDGAARLWSRGVATTVDLLGEKTTTDEQADRYAARVSEMLDALLAAAPHWPDQPHLDADDKGRLARVNISVKPTALAPHYGALTREQGIEEAVGRLEPILARADAGGAHIHFDMEHLEVKDLTLELFERTCRSHPALSTGIVIQAYLRDAYDDLASVIAHAGRRPTPVTVRLVKGAYWDTETIVAEAEGWPVPVFEAKDDTDANYERCADLLHDNHRTVRSAFGTHNLRSMAAAVVGARRRGIPESAVEIQMLHGMAEPLQAAVTGAGLRLRLYAPVGELVPGMAYLVRRLLENTSNEGFVRARFAEERDLDDLLVPPDGHDLPGAPVPVIAPDTDVEDPQPYHHEPHAEWRRAPVRHDFQVAISGISLGREVPALIGGRRSMTAERIVSPDPASPSTTVVWSASCGVDHADAAVDAGLAAQPAWGRRPARERAAVLFRAAAWLRARRNQVAALEVFECGKPWKEADADVCEAIDFLEYYGREAIRLADGGPVESPPGERNTLSYEALGVGVVIAPWNFPLAIPAGMTVAALAAGNAVILKPAEQAPGVAWKIAEALEAAGLPEGVLGFLPGQGEVIGAHLVAHPQVAFVAFTGSSAVGLEIIREAAVHRPGQRQVKRVVAEMGGKNAIVVDADADLDAAVPDIITSAFGYAGQKCSAASRVVVLDEVHDELVTRLVGAARILQVGHPSAMATQLGPLIDADALAKVRAYAAMAPEEGTVVLHQRAVPAEGWFHGPVIVDGVQPGSRLATEEIFGPVLSVQRAADIDEALAVANATDFALTAGIMSRSPATIRRASAELRAGNVYVNRSTTGAIVGRQPFGCWGLSGVGSKAGGPDYLLQFTLPRAVTENTIRQGFAELD